MGIREMVHRNSDFSETQDYIPTPPFATRALYEHVAPELKRKAFDTTILDPACGAGHMTSVFLEYGHAYVVGSDAYPRDQWKPLTADIHYRRDFVGEQPDEKTNVGYIVTNPPYKHLAAFIKRALEEATHGVAMLVRVQALESENRYNEIFTVTPPTRIGFFANRIPFKTGVVVKKAPKMFFHVWLWWEKDAKGELVPPKPPLWIPYNVQSELEKDEDYVE